MVLNTLIRADINTDTAENTIKPAEDTEESQSIIPEADIQAMAMAVTGMVMIMPTDMVIRAKKILKKQKKRKNKTLKVWR